MASPEPVSRTAIITIVTLACAVPLILSILLLARTICLRLESTRPALRDKLHDRKIHSFLRMHRVIPQCPKCAASAATTARDDVELARRSVPRGSQIVASEDRASTTRAPNLGPPPFLAPELNDSPFYFAIHDGSFEDVSLDTQDPPHNNLKRANTVKQADISSDRSTARAR